MRRRAELVDQTRQRITEATMRLHTTIGPASTTITGVAEEAGVTRLTVYRHFPDEEQLYSACTSHWIAQHPRPDPDSWRRIKGLEERAAHALNELYAWYGQNADALYLFRRDAEAMPASVRNRTQAADFAAADALVAGSGRRGRRRRLLRAAAGHVVRYATWRSLAVEEGLNHDEAVRLAVRFFLTADAET